MVVLAIVINVIAFIAEKVQNKKIQKIIEEKKE